MTTKRQHSPYGGSGRARWAACPPSVKLSIPYEKEEEHVLTPEDIVRAIATDHLKGAPDRISAAFEGSLGHSVLELAGKGEIQLSQLRGKYPHLLSRDLLEGVALCLDFISLKMRSDPKAHLFLEQEFILAPDAWGSADAVIALPTLGEVWIIDLKLGKGYWVDAQNNPQLRYYAVGVLGAGIVSPIIDKWHLCIVQPRYVAEDDHMIRWETLSQADVHAEKARIFAEIERSKASDGKSGHVPGPYCRWCPGAVACPAQAKVAIETAGNDFEAAATAPADAAALFGCSLGQLLRRLDSVEEWGKRVREWAYQEAEAGRCPDGWKLVAKRATRKFRGDLQNGVLVDVLKAGLGLPDSVVFTPPEVRSVAQIEAAAKLEGLKFDHEKFMTLVEAKSSGYNLVTEESKGEPVQKGNPADEFTVKLSSEELAKILL